MLIRPFASAAVALVLAGCTTADVLLPRTALAPGARPVETAASGGSSLDRKIAASAAAYDVPESLVRRVVKRESNFRPEARNGPYYGLMQILPATARTMGHRGPPSELLDAETNLRYAVKYLRGAYIVAGGNHDQAVRLYARGYYYDAKRKGLLVETGLKPGQRAAQPATAVAAAPERESAPAAAFMGATPSGPARVPAFQPTR